MDWKKIGKKLLFPPIWLQIILAVISAAALMAVFVKGWERSPVAYGVYVLSFYTLSVICIFCAKVLPKQFRRIRDKVLEIQAVYRFLNDQTFSTRVTLYLSFGVNLLYVAVNVISYFLYRSWWFVCLAVYYVIMSVMRFLLVRYVRVQELGCNLYGELKRTRLCSCVMLLLNLFLSGAVLMITYQSKGYEYHGIMIYVMAIYTFYITANAIRNICVYRNFDRPVMAAAKVISLAAALVSMLNLETAMFASFGSEMPQKDQNLMIMLTGAGVSIVVVTMSVYMIVRSTIEIKKLRSGENG